MVRTLCVVCLAAAAAEVPSLLLALMARDEEANLRANLPRLSELTDAAVCGVDDRTVDASARAVTETLRNAAHFVFYLRFAGFGRARTEVFREGWAAFPRASHVLVLDPDWEATPGTLKKAQLDFKHRTFLFTVWDRNGLTMRTLNWLVRWEAGLSFEHQLHEQLVQPPARQPGHANLLTWRFVERADVRMSWHAAHGHSQSYGRYLADLEVLKANLGELGPNDSHTLYYLGVTHLSALEALLGIGEHPRTAQAEEHMAGAVAWLTLRLKPPIAAVSAHEHTLAATRWLGHAHQYLTHDRSAAHSQYEACVTFDNTRVDCRVFLAKLARDEGLNPKAFTAAFKALSLAAAPRFSENIRMVDHFYVERCALPIEAALALLPTLEAVFARSATENVLVVFGAALLTRGALACDDPIRRFITEPPGVVSAARARYGALLLPEAACVTRVDALAAANGDAVTLAVMEAWTSGRSSARPTWI
mmetsp:Transcript_10887/g.32488  ORF Transcript_10887/g.32488 Transcript_10887/m.32488 type:complete len:477 (+) Transcript_10887:271-1701(+)